MDIIFCLFFHSMTTLRLFNEAIQGLRAQGSETVAEVGVMPDGFGNGIEIILDFDVSLNKK